MPIIYSEKELLPSFYYASIYAYDLNIFKHNCKRLSRYTLVRIVISF